MKNPLVYVHDLDLANEKNVRQMIIKSGASNALRVRFVEHMHGADIWVLRSGSALLQHIDRLAGSANAPLVWLYEDGALFDRNDAHAILTTERLVAILENGFRAGGKAAQPVPSSAAGADLVHLCRDGLAAAQGSLLIQATDHVIRFDFDKRKAFFNEAVKEDLRKRECAISQFSVAHSEPKERLAFSADIRQVLWLLAQGKQAGKTSLLPALADGAALRIPRWPNLSGLPYKPEDYGVISLLQRRALGLKDLLALLPTDESRIIPLLNALYLCNMADIDQQAHPLSMVGHQRQRAPLASLWRMFRFARA